MRSLLPALAGLLSLAAAEAGAQVAPVRNAKGTVQITRSAQVRNLQEMNFAYLAVTAAGTAVIDPNTDRMTTTGGVLHAGGQPYAALFEGISPVKGVVIVRLPRNPTTLTRVGGTQTMTLSNWTISGNNDRRTVAAQQPFNFKVGGTLTVNANQAEGTYVGTFNVDVQYP